MRNNSHLESWNWGARLERGVQGSMVEFSIREVVEGQMMGNFGYHASKFRLYPEGIRIPRRLLSKGVIWSDTYFIRKMTGNIFTAYFPLHHTASHYGGYFGS